MPQQLIEFKILETRVLPNSTHEDILTLARQLADELPPSVSHPTVCIQQATREVVNAKLFLLSK